MAAEFPVEARLAVLRRWRRTERSPDLPPMRARVIPPPAGTAGAGLASMRSWCLAVLAADRAGPFIGSPREVTLCPVQPPFYRSSLPR